MKQLIILGAGNFGRELYWHAQESLGYNNDFVIKGFLDDDYDNTIEKYQRLPGKWIGKIEDYKIDNDDVFICAIGDSSGREAVVNKIKDRGGKFINLINRTSIIQGEVQLGEGVFLGPYTILADNVRIGNHVMLNTLSSVGHDAIIGDYTCIMSHVDVTGWCQIGKRVYLASGVRMVPKTRIEDDAYVGIGSVVIRKVKSGKKVFGNPAKVLDV